MKRVYILTADGYLSVLDELWFSIKYSPVFLPEKSKWFEFFLANMTPEPEDKWEIFFFLLKKRRSNFLKSYVHNS